ncbi:MAG TPA: thioredoxin domain-containing protein [Baekduia sp.]|uniref:DsbA family protein n=1 Tax=Baekduia sp. TaxID=2600305 RepID=UPI002D79DEA8|nr:thioredoxin domain-containing protein [Baekduia sp.]HET6510360.1 thioredoxin domain-containing protein [Baekduia sp.]
MSQNPSPSKRERKEAARAERLERERADAAAASRRKRMTLLGGLLVGAIAIVVVAVAISSGGSKKSSGGDASSIQGAADAKAMLAGIPQSGTTLGKPDAPVTILEFADPQCPYCKEYTLNEMPKVIQDDVRTGKAKMQLNYLTFIGPDSVKAASVLEAAGLQNKLWTASDVFYRNQGEENSGYVTDDFLTAVLDAAGADSAKAIAAAGDPKVTAALGEAKTGASRYGVDSTPTILVGPTGGQMTQVQGTPTAAAISKLVDQAAAKAGT